MQKLVIAVAGMILLAGAGWASVQEASLYLTDSLPQTDRITAVIDGTSVPGLAISTQTSYLLSCYDLLRSATLKAEAPERGAALAKACRTRAEDIAQQSQASSLAWFVAAFAAAKTGSMDAMQASLRNSYLTGPHEQWLALLRIPLAEANRPALEADLKGLADQDLVNIVDNRAGMDSLIDRYTKDAAFRERLTGLMEKASPNQQRRFLMFLRSSIQAAGGQS